MIINGVTVRQQDGITDSEAESIVQDEIAAWAKLGKKIAEIDLTIDGEDVIVKATELSPIKRIARITGYLAPIDSFNPSKKRELADRLAQAR